MMEMPNREPKMVCPACFFVPEIDRLLPAGYASPGMTEKRSETDRWLDYIAHLLEHLLEKAHD